MKLIHRSALVIALLLSVVASATTIDMTKDDAAQFGHPFKQSVHALQPRASQVRVAHRRTSSGRDRVPVAAVWARHSLNASLHLDLSRARFAPRPASTFPPYWDSLHLTI